MIVNKIYRLAASPAQDLIRIWHKAVSLTCFELQRSSVFSFGIIDMKEKYGSQLTET